MSRRSTVRRVEEFALFDVLCEDGTRTLNRKSTGSELVDIEVGLLAKTYIEARKLPRSRENHRTPVLDPRASPLSPAGARQRRQHRNPRPEEKNAA